MLNKEQFDPKNFIDRAFEQELFEELLQFKAVSRILAITDEGGSGKSELLKQFQYRCRTVPPRIPVSLVDLGQLCEEDNRPLAFIKKIEQDLKKFKVNFLNFVNCNLAIASGNFTAISSCIYLQDANLQDAQNTKIATLMVNAEKVGIMTVRSDGSSILTPAQQMIADEICIESFFSDLKQICKENIVVILLDAFEKCEQKLRVWIEDSFLASLFFDVDDQLKLLLVVAGRELPAFSQKWPPADCDAIVTSVKGLHKWGPEHVEQCLRVHDFDCSPKTVKYYYQFIQKGCRPSDVVDLIETRKRLIQRERELLRRGIAS